MADNRPIGAKIERISDKDIAKDCDRVSFVFGFCFSGLSVFITLPGPDLELLDKGLAHALGQTPRKQGKFVKKERNKMRKERQGKGNKEKETYQRVPRPSAQADAIIADAQAAYAVLVAAQRAHLVSSEYIPHLQAVLMGGLFEWELWMTYLALKVIITRKQQSARNRESNRRNTTQYLVAL